MADATVFNPETGDRQAVESGSNAAQALFDQGYQLEQSYDPNTGQSLAVTPEQPEIDIGQTNPNLITPPPQYDSTAYASEIQKQTQSSIEQFQGGALAEERSALANEITAAQKAADESKLELEGALGEDFDRNELFKQFQKEAGIQKKETDLNAILQEMNDETAAFNRGKTALVGESSTMKLLRGKQAILQDQYNAKMTWLSGNASIIQGNLDRASNLVTRYFDNAVADRTDRINNLGILADMDSKGLITLTAEDKALAQEQKNLLTSINDRQIAEKDAIRNLMLDETISAVWDKAGVDMTMPLDDILKKLQPFVAAEQGRRFNAIHGDNTVDTDAGVFGDADFKNAGVIAQDPTTGEWGVNINALDTFFTIRGIATKDRNAIVNAANLAADNLNAGTTQNSGLEPMQSIPTGAFGFPEGTTSGSAFVQSLAQTPQTFGKMNQSLLTPFKAIGKFGGEILDETIGRTLFGNE